MGIPFEGWVAVALPPLTNLFNSQWLNYTSMRVLSFTTYVWAWRLISKVARMPFDLLLSNVRNRDF